MGLFDNIDFNSMVNSFADIGGFNVMLPFLLIFAISFAILRKIDLFKNNKVDAVVGLIFAGFLVSATEIVDIIVAFLPKVSLIVLVLLMLILVVGIFSGGSEWGNIWLLVGAIVAILSVLWALGASADWDVPLIDDITEQDVGTLLVIGVFVLVIWLIVREPGGSDNRGGGFLDSIDKIVSGLKGSGGGKGKE